MKFKLNKKILTTIGLSFSLIIPIVLTSCSDSTPQQQVQDHLGSNIVIGGFQSQDISDLYKIHGNKIYYKDHNDLLTLDLSKLLNIEEIQKFAFGDFDLEINRLILPPNAHQIRDAAFYPKTEKGYTYAKNGINPMFKVKNKKNTIDPRDKHFFQLDVSQLGVYHEKYGSNGYGNGYTKRQGLPTQIYPIESFEFINQDSRYDKFQLKDPSHPLEFSFSSPPLPLNLLSNTNYLKFYVNQNKIEIIKKIIKPDNGGFNFIDNNAKQHILPFLYFPFGNSEAPNAHNTFYLDPVTNEYLMPTIVGHPYLFKYIVATTVYNQISRRWNSSTKKYVYSKSNDIFSSGNQLRISFINQFTEGTKDQEVINLTLDDTILKILNYDFKEGAANNTDKLNPEQIAMLEKWNKEYGMLDDFYGAGWGVS